MLDLGSLMLKKILLQKDFMMAVLKNFPICLEGCLAFRPQSGYLQLRFPAVIHLNFFDYYEWNEREIKFALKNCANWSIPDSIATDWHSDCLFHLFKEYMFIKIYRATYTDAFLSNQIRHGRITRETALEESDRCMNYYKTELSKAISYLGLEHVRSRIDYSCF